MKNEISFVDDVASLQKVDLSLVSSVKPGMKVEAPNQPSALNPYLTYWVASVVAACGTLLLLRYEGYGDDRSGDFWCDLRSRDIHPVGWCARNGQMLQPPDGKWKNHWCTWKINTFMSVNQDTHCFFSWVRKRKNSTR